MRQLSKSKFFVALIAFAALSLLAGAYKLWQAKPTDYPYHTWTTWAIDDFLKQQTPANLVFLGSSLVLVPMAGVDADYLNQRLDGSQHHRSVYFEHEFEQKTGSTAKTFNFALPGQMPSDAYLITDFLLKQEHRPQVIVWGLGPRDFMDNLLPSPIATDGFCFLSRFGDISSIATRLMPGWVDYLNFALGKTVYWYGHREDISDKTAALACTALSSFLPAPLSLLSRDEVHKLLPQYHPFELERGQSFFRPSTAQDLAQFTDNLGEYRKRYKTLNWDTFLTQMHFYSDTLSLARSRGTHVVVVAMPITDLNRQLLNDYAWRNYRQTIKAIALAHGASFVDFSENSSFKRSDFGDTVHLHSAGGKRWLDKLVDRLAADRSVRSCLANPDRRTAGVCSADGGAI